MNQAIKDYITAIEYNIEGYKIRKEYRAAEAAERVILDLKKMLSA